MSNITINIKGQFVSLSGKNAGGAGNANANAVQFVFDKEWDGFGKRVIWCDAKGENETSVLLVPQIAEKTSVYISYIPATVMKIPGWCSFTVEGYYESEPQRVQKSVSEKLFVAYSQSDSQNDIRVSEAMQLHTEFEALMPSVNALMTDTKKNITLICDNINKWETYNNQSLYKKGNKVSFNGECYVCINDVSGVSPENDAFWLLIAKRGEQGERGIQGPQGVSGQKGEKGDKGEKGEKGEKGIQGDAGINAIVAPVNGFYSFSVDEKGQLWVNYPDETSPPQMHINENDELIITIPESSCSYNVGKIKGEDGYTPQKGIDYFTPEDIAFLEIPAAEDIENIKANADVAKAKSEVNYENIAVLKSRVNTCEPEIEKLHYYYDKDIEINADIEIVGEVDSDGNNTTLGFNMICLDDNSTIVIPTPDSFSEETLEIIKNYPINPLGENPNTTVKKIIIPRGLEFCSDEKLRSYFTAVSEIVRVGEDIPADVNANAKMLNSLKYYGDADVIPSDASLFSFTVNDETMTASVSANSELMDRDLYELTISGDIVIPYKYNVNDKTYTVNSINDSAFYRGCSITGVVLPNTIKTIGKSAFEDCFGLKYANIPLGITSIPQRAFAYCHHWTKITIPDSVKTIDESAFAACDSITDVYYQGTKAQWDTIEIGADNGSFETATIHYDWTDATKGYVDEKIGEIDAALDNIIAIQNTLIGGENV